MPVQLYEEYCNALACYEKALLFSTSIKKADIIPMRYIDWDATGNSPLLPGVKVDDVYAHITEVRSEAGALLCDRLTILTDKYLLLTGKLNDDHPLNGLVKGLLSEEVWQSFLPDRDAKVTKFTREDIFARFQQLVDAAGKSLNSKPLGYEEACQHYWLGMHKLCILLMEEIVYLSQRVNDIRSLLHSHISIRLPLLSILIALIALVISVLGYVHK